YGAENRLRPRRLRTLGAHERLDRLRAVDAVTPVRELDDGRADRRSILRERVDADAWIGSEVKAVGARFAEDSKDATTTDRPHTADIEQAIAAVGQQEHEPGRLPPARLDREM